VVTVAGVVVPSGDDQQRSGWCDQAADVDDRLAARWVGERLDADDLDHEVKRM
jgi:hypothetical protein